jgi:hypothetical protein
MCPLLEPLSIHLTTDPTPQVLGMGHWLQVSRIYTASVATQVVKFEPCRDLSHAQVPGDAVGVMEHVLDTELSVTT